MTPTKKTIILSALIMLMAPVVFADVYINVMAVNGAPERKELPVKYNLPGDLKGEDILDTAGLQLEYNVNDANYFVFGTIALEPKESKTFRIRLKDIWKMTPEQMEDIKAQIEKGFEQIGKIAGTDPAKAEALKNQLLQKLDYLQDQGVRADTVEKRIDAYRTYAKELQRIKSDALAVDYWRSEPGQTKDRLIRYRIEVENPASNPSKTVKQKHYLPSEIKPEHVVEAEGFEVRFDQQRNQPFLFKEEDIPQGEKKSYTVGILDIWSIPQRDIDYLRRRADYTIDFLKSSPYAQSAQMLYERAMSFLKMIEDSQSQKLEIKEHISAFRANEKTMEEARRAVESLEQLLAIYRENLEKSKIKNVMNRLQSFKDVSNISNQVFKKKPTESNTWQYIAWGVGFVTILTGISFLVWTLRSGAKKAEQPPASAAKEP